MRLLRQHRLLSKYVRLSSTRHGEPFIKVDNGDEQEIWTMVRYCVNLPKKEAIQVIMQDLGLTRNEAEAAWVYIFRNPLRARMLSNRHTGAYAEVFLEPEITP